MQYKSVKHSLARSADRLGGCGVFLVALGLVSGSAWGAPTVSPVAPYAFATSSVLWRAYSPTLIDTDAGFNDVVLTASAASPDTGSLIQIDVSTSETFASPSDPTWAVPVVSIRVVTTSNGERTIPIAAVDGTACTTSTCQGVLGSYYYAAKFTSGDTIRIGFYLDDLCAGTNAVTAPEGPVTATGCDTVTPTDIIAPTPTVPASFNLKVYVAEAATDGGIATYASADAGTSFTVKVQDGEPVGGTCPDRSNIYFPGDSELLVEPSVFSSYVTAVAYRAPLSHLIVGATLGASIPDGATFPSSSIAPGRFGFGVGTQTMSGFQNTEATGDSNTYGISFAVRDLAGAMTPFACGAAGVRTSAIDGYLRANKCFIATAAYGVKDAPGLDLLREFRDEILLGSSGGTRFVEWYYAWSPRAAHWLIENPVFRGPVRALLLPLQILAWFCLHPLFFAFACLAGCAYWIHRSQRSGESTA